MNGYADLAHLPEDNRIAIIGREVTVHHKTVAVAIDDERKKIERYKRKLHDANPGLLDIEELPGLVANTVILKIKPKSQNVAGN